MTRPDDGGSAFPQIETEARTSEYGIPYSDTYSTGGISLRDDFAAHAPVDPIWASDISLETHAKCAYLWADAMLKARAK